MFEKKKVPRVSENFFLFLIPEIQTHTCTCMRTRTAQTFFFFYQHQKLFRTIASHPMRKKSNKKINPWFLKINSDSTITNIFVWSHISLLPRFHQLHICLWCFLLMLISPRASEGLNLGPLWERACSRPLGSWPTSESGLDNRRVSPQAKKEKGPHAELGIHILSAHPRSHFLTRTYENKPHPGLLC